MEILCPSCEKKLLLRLQPELHCNTWCGTCNQEVPEETLLEAGAPDNLLAQIPPWAKKVQELLEVEDDGIVGGDRSDEDYVKAWKALRAGTDELLRRLRTTLPAGTSVFGAAKPPEWSDDEIIRWRRQREREGLLFGYGYQQGARFVQDGGLPLSDGEKLPIDYPTVCVTPSEKKRYRSGFTLGSQSGSFDTSLYKDLETKIRKKK